MEGTFTEEGRQRKKQKTSSKKVRTKRASSVGSSGKRPTKKLNNRTEKAIEKSSDPVTSTSPDRIESPTLKKSRLDGDFTGSVTPIVVSAPVKTTFTIAEHTSLPAMTKVKLLPSIATKNGAITGISFGRNRTPSPFGNRMGDHTGSWASVVDSVHARLFGKNVNGALAELETMQAEAQAWMRDDTSVGMRMWNLLDPADQLKRQPVLENYAFQVGDLIEKARTVLKSRGLTPDTQAAADTNAAELLAQAAAHHLAYLNFLPFATVPAKSGRSTGSGEGTSRAKALAIELDVEADRQWNDYLKTESPKDKEERLKEEKAAKLAQAQAETPEETEQREKAAAEQAAADKVKQRRDALDGLWGLFSMDAAVRTADLDRVVAPTRIAGHVTQLRQLQSVAGLVSASLNQFVLADQAPAKTPTNKKKRRLSQKVKLTSGVDAFFGDLAAWTKTVTRLKEATDLPYPEVRQLATEVSNAIAHMKGAMGKLGPGQSDTSKQYQQNIAQMVDGLDKVIARLTPDPDTAREQSALLLAHLVHDHQAAVARAYPNAVSQTGFLGDNPDQTAKEKAAERIRAFITGRDGITDAEDDAVGRLIDKIKELYPTVGATPTPAPDALWVGDSRNASLVSAFSGEQLSIQGRPAAPPGVEGMGSHSTAWVVETDWVQRKLKEVQKKGIVSSLQGAALEELNGPLMTKLAHILPAEQLAGGQLGIIFDAALDVLAATEPADAVTAYLSFRNLLPYATVDAGIRAGHAERTGAKSSVVFDSTSLNAAITQKLGELAPDRLKTTIDTLAQAAESLQTDYAATADPTTSDSTSTDLPELTWKSNDKVKTAIEATIKALTDEVVRLRTAQTTKSDATKGVGEQIFSTRKTEHDQVYAYAYPTV